MNTISDSRGGSTFLLMITCARDGRIYLRNGVYTFKVRVMRGRRAYWDYLEMNARQLSCFDVLIAEGVIVPPVDSYPAELIESKAYDFIAKLNAVK